MENQADASSEKLKLGFCGVLDYIFENHSKDHFSIPKQENPFTKDSPNIVKEKFSLLTSTGRKEASKKKEQRKMSKQVDKSLREEKNSLLNMVQFVCIGEENVGITTFFKQMKILFSDGFTEEDRKIYKNEILNNILVDIQTLLRLNQAKFNDSELQKIATEIEKLNLFECNWSEKLASNIKTLWFSEPIQKVLSSQKGYKLEIEYYFLNLDRIGKANYVPDDQDILRSRRLKNKFHVLHVQTLASPVAVEKNTSGIDYFSNISNDLLFSICRFLHYRDILSLGCTNKFFYQATNSPMIWKYLCRFLNEINDDETNWKFFFLRRVSRKKHGGFNSMIQLDFNFQSIPFRLIDISSQANTERRKWIHQFDSCTALAYFFDLSTYDCVNEDGQNLFSKQLDLFDHCVNSIWFQHAAVVVFLNKRDLFEEKLKHTPLTVSFPEYTGNTFEQAIDFLREKIYSRNKFQNAIYAHICVSIDTMNIKYIWDATRDIVLHRCLCCACLI